MAKSVCRTGHAAAARRRRDRHCRRRSCCPASWPRVVFGITTHDPLTFAALPVLVTAATTLACYLPARRAARVDPVARDQARLSQARDATYRHRCVKCVRMRGPRFSTVPQPTHRTHCTHLIMPAEAFMIRRTFLVLVATLVGSLTLEAGSTPQRATPGNGDYAE